jgi:hypothetical protein
MHAAIYERVKSNLTLLPIISLALLHAVASGQTTVVAVRTATEVVVGADSKGISGDVKSSRLMCKIGQVGNLLFAYAGHGGDTATGFDPAAIATKVGNTKGTVSEKARRFGAEAEEPLTVSLTLLRQINAPLYKVVAEDSPPLQAAFFGAEKDSPVLYQVTFRASSDLSGSVRVASEINEVVVEPSGGKSIIVMGQRTDIDSILRAYPNFWDVGLIDGVRWLVTLEAITRPQVVGMPVDLVRVDKLGAHWIQRKPECEEKKHSTPGGRKPPRD